uniref:Uncharacterized protein n=1 Tax=Arundo donax TaxID=35708 RepID=A0A0A9HMG5_ARUDO
MSFSFVPEPWRIAGDFLTGVTRGASSAYLSTVFLSLDGRSIPGAAFFGVGVFFSAAASPFFRRPRFFSGCCGVASRLPSAGSGSGSASLVPSAGGSAAAGEAGLASSEAMGGRIGGRRAELGF